MLTLSIILIFIVSVLMILIVLAQNPKGGGLSSTFGGGGQMGGVVQTNKFLDKTTWILAISMIVFSVTASLSLDQPKENPESKIQKELMELNQTSIPQVPTQKQVDEFKKKEKQKKDLNLPK
ncbi:MAG: preprotein translocase subunit SecG [Chlorobi bacterium]|nr:preprotein translocase subunit SecG [Chlorobiota bacterium]